MARQPAERADSLGVARYNTLHIKKLAPSSCRAYQSPRGSEWCPVCAPDPGRGTPVPRPPNVPPALETVAQWGAVRGNASRMQSASVGRSERAGSAIVNRTHTPIGRPRRVTSSLLLPPSVRALRSELWSQYVRPRRESERRSPIAPNSLLPLRRRQPEQPVDRRGSPSRTYA